MIRKIVYEQYYGAWLPVVGGGIFASSDQGSADIDYRLYPFDDKGSGRSFYLTYDQKRDSYLFFCITKVIETPGDREDSAFAHVVRMPGDIGNAYDAMRASRFVTGTAEILQERQLEKLVLECDGDEPEWPFVDRDTLARILYQLIFVNTDGGFRNIYIRCGSVAQFNTHMRSVAAFLYGLLPAKYARDTVIGMSETVFPKMIVSLMPDSVSFPDDAGLVLQWEEGDRAGGELRTAAFKDESIRYPKFAVCLFLAEQWQQSDHREPYDAKTESLINEYKQHKLQACYAFLYRNGQRFSDALKAAQFIQTEHKLQRKWYGGQEELGGVMADICLSAADEAALSEVLDLLVETEGYTDRQAYAPLLAGCLDALAENGRVEDALAQYQRICSQNKPLAERMAPHIVHREAFFPETAAVPEKADDAFSAQTDAADEAVREDKKKLDSECSWQDCSDGSPQAATALSTATETVSASDADEIGDSQSSVSLSEERSGVQIRDFYYDGDGAELAESVNDELEAQEFPPEAEEEPEEQEGIFNQPSEEEAKEPESDFNQPSEEEPEEQESIFNLSSEEEAKEPESDFNQPSEVKPEEQEVIFNQPSEEETKEPESDFNQSSEEEPEDLDSFFDWHSWKESKARDSSPDRSYGNVSDSSTDSADVAADSADASLEDSGDRNRIYAFFTRIADRISFGSKWMSSLLILLAVLLVFALGMVFGSIQFNVIAAVAGIVLFIATAVLFRLLNRLEVSKEIGSYIDGMIGILLLLLFYIIVLRLLQVI